MGLGNPIGRMRCPQGVVISYDGTTIEDESKRCTGEGPVYHDPATDKALLLECPKCKPGETTVIRLSRRIWESRITVE